MSEASFGRRVRRNEDPALLRGIDVEGARRCEGVAAVVPGTEPGLEATAYFGPARGATASGVHAMQVAVDPEAFQVKVTDYVVVRDCGRVINPLILDGQIHGGVAHGVGNAFFEQLVFGSGGQLQNASFTDYLLPTALDVLRIRIDHMETPAADTPLGVKGAGEAR